MADPAAKPAPRHLLTIRKCPSHGYMSICVDEKDGPGTRVTPSKCCGRWDLVKGWKLSAREWWELARLAEEAADDLEGRDD